MRKSLILFVVFMLALVPVTVFAQTGTIAGKVTIEKTGDPLPNAAVFLGDSKTGTYTQKDGSFILKNVQTGMQEVTASFMGYKKQTKEIIVNTNETSVVNFVMEIEAVLLGKFSVNETRATKRETPIAFTDLSQEQVGSKYTTEDVPQLLDGVPGFFSATGGLGEGELKVRGFDQDKVQILINGIPVNDPESQQVYWSNWTGLSSNVKSIQVQRGAGSSLYGSGVFGGSINIETIGVGSDPSSGWTFRTSAGTYSAPDKVADGKGNMVDFTPYNYNLLIRYQSGNLKGGKFNYAVSVERKVGEFYQIGTFYDGWSFGAEVQNLWGAHKVNTSLIIAPQWHNQARAQMDLKLLDKLGRNYNRFNCPQQVNYFNKPQLSIRDEWKINDSTLLMTNIFFTRGDGGGKYLRNDEFDTETGRVMYKDVSEYTDNKYFGRHARHIYEETGVVLDGYDPSDSTYYGSFVSKPANAPNKDFSHTWQNDSQNHHKQFGLNTYLDHQLNDMIKLTVGGEMRYWRALHKAYTRDVRYYGGTYDQGQTRYNYDGIVTNISGFLRTQIKPIPELNIVLDGQYASYTSRVEENPIQIFDYGLGMHIDEYYYATKANFEEGDYEKTYDFFSPKAGINYNITDYLNVLANFSIAKKEPRQTDWYDRANGPDYRQTWTDSLDVVHVEELDSETATTYEAGIGYEGVGWNLAANYYMTNYEDKLESVYTHDQETLTINAGSAIHQGLEVETNLMINNFDLSVSGTYSQNRWDKMNVEEVFGDSAKHIVDNVVPFSPEQMAAFALGYTFEDLPMDGSLRIGFSGNWWDEYYGNYTNEYYTEYIENPDGWGYIPVEESLEDAKLPYFVTFNSDITYRFKVGGKDASIKLDIKNINNREDNYSRAAWTTDYGRQDELNGVQHMYVTPAPLFNAFLTAEVSF